jgi:hypothetical protein
LTTEKSRSPSSAARSSSSRPLRSRPAPRRSWRAGRGVRPVEADAGGARWSFSARFSAGSASATPASALVLAAAALGRLQRFPAGALGRVAEDVRVAADHLVADRRRARRRCVEGAEFLGDAGVVDDLELEIAELVLEVAMSPRSIASATS